MPAASAQLSQFIALPSRDGVRHVPRPGLLRRIAAALAQAHERRIEREAAIIIERHGGRMSDALEREIEQRLMST